MMTKSEIALLREDLAAIAPRAEDVCWAFCQRLFELDMTLRPLFPAELRPLVKHLAIGLNTVASSLDDLGPVLRAAPAVGLLLASYGMEPIDLPTVAAAYLATLERELGASFTREARSAWLQMFWIIALATFAGMTEMRQAA